MIDKLFSSFDELIYLVTNFFDPIPPYKKKEFLDVYVRRIDKRHALRFLKHKIDRHLDLSIDIEDKKVNEYGRKRDKKLVGSLIFMMRKAQDEEINLYNRIRIGY